MPDNFDRLVADVRRLEARARVGALDEINAQKLHWTEFGTKHGDEQHSEPRPTMSAAFDRNERAMQRAVDRRIAAVLDGTSEASGRRILSEVGEDFAEAVREEIGNNVPPVLADSTLAARERKGQGDRTLMATGDMQKSIRVESKGDAKPWPDDDG